MTETTSAPAASPSSNEQCGIKPKPCCVCKPEKASRDECILLNGQESGKCDDLIVKYKTCMKGFGFEI